jgi:hypothetical protein
MQQFEERVDVAAIERLESGSGAFDVLPRHEPSISQGHTPLVSDDRFATTIRVAVPVAPMIGLSA